VLPVALVVLVPAPLVFALAVPLVVLEEALVEGPVAVDELPVALFAALDPVSGVVLVVGPLLDAMAVLFVVSPVPSIH